MKILVNANVYGWRMTGLLGKGAKWFFGFSKKPKDVPNEPRLVSFALDLSTCTLNFDGVEYYYQMKEISDNKQKGELNGQEESRSGST